ncbi:TetR/AcrR family transcriptional regulator [Cognatiyoonia sp. IB215182]|uniref:TetR/AcrR family transcriptional regulator n=1 Tax=Cognatiyoonia sp. IB215182 TaxID=3097353 RepID=UPI002A11B463|nr:TetR/AcrR family transcriptional regulator [Cognatiyoonia sp. IB215182]MDX8352345.1 TetR/AcrR family transcriptional regulator [Cognatiyoonia sp. IB215182]
MNSETLPPRVRRTREKILAAATELFLSKGFVETRMDEVAAQAKVSKQTLYAHAGTKEALFLEMAERMIADAVAAQRKATAEPQRADDPYTFLLAHARQQLRTAHDPNLMQIRRVAIAEAARFPDFGKAVFELGPGSSINRLERAFSKWHAAGKLNTPEPRRAAETFNWLIMGGPTSEAMLTGAAKTLKPGAADAHLTECVRVFWAAYGITTSLPRGD